MRARLTYLAPYVPHAAIPHAGGQFLFRYLAHLAHSFDIVLVAPGSPLNRAAALDEVPVETHLIPVRRRPRTLVGLAPRVLANAVAGVTPGWHVLHAFRRDEKLWSRVSTSDLVELQFGQYLPFVSDIRRRAPGVPVTAFEHDVLAESLRRRAVGGFLHERTFGRVAAARARRVEPILLNQCDAAFTFSDRERTLLHQMGVNIPIEVVSPVVGQHPPSSPNTQRPVVLFVGAMDRPENHQGALWLATKVWPAVLRSHPNARLVLAGTSPPAALLEVAGPSVEVTGFVADLEAWYQTATVFVAPNLTGAGVKFKVIDAFSHGLPVVATPIAAEGIVEGPLSAGFAAVTDDPAAMAAVMVRLLSDPAEARRIGEAGHAWVQARYDFDASMATVVRTYRSLIARSRENLAG
ncbi:MAG: polysaccharide biosynthesis protein PslH [Actinomycetota bacterium]|nr:polysaccharide biosynthesis protein PslH [Actinomycetota bacterium]